MRPFSLKPATTEPQSPMTKNQTPLFAAALMLSACGVPHDTDGTPGKFEETSQTNALGGLCRRNAIQPTVCSYGDYCNPDSSMCSTVPPPTCNNFAIHGTNWDASTSTGPVIYQATTISFAANDAYCPQPGMVRAKFRLMAYAPEADLPTTLDGFYNRLYGVTPSGAAYNVSAVQNITTSHDNKNTTFDVSLCLASGTMSYTAGFFFVGGNEICVTAS